jgi:DDE superfamily endonuclease
LSLQVVTYIAKQRDAEQREQLYKTSLNELMFHPGQLVFLDETAKDQSASRRRHFWSPRGLTPTSTSSFQGSHGKRYSMIAACDWNGFILETCHIVERERDGTVNKEVFTFWLYDHLIPLLGDYSRQENRSIVVLNNATIHHSDEIVELIESTGAIILYLAPYSPDLNPIELMFGQ